MDTQGPSPRLQADGDGRTPGQLGMAFVLRIVAWQRHGCEDVGATGEAARLIKYGYTVEFDRQFQLAAVTAEASEQQREFEQLQRVRNKR